MRTLLVLLILSPLFAFAEGDWNSVMLNKKGSDALKEQNFAEGYRLFVEALSSAPFQPELHLNLGISFEGRNEGDKAVQSYLTAEKLSNDPSLRFMSLFNVAQAYGKAKKVDEALRYYQQALELDPFSKEVKTNIELLVQSQKGGGGGGGDQNKEDKDKKDDKDKNKDQEKKDQDKKDDKQDEKKDGKDKDDKKYDDPREQKGQKPQDPQELSESDVQKIFGELKQQEQKIRAEYQKREAKEKPHGKDW